MQFIFSLCDLSDKTGYSAPPEDITFSTVYSQPNKNILQRLCLRAGSMLPAPYNLGLSGNIKFCPWHCSGKGLD